MAATHHVPHGIIVIDYELDSAAVRAVFVDHQRGWTDRQLKNQLSLAVATHSLIVLGVIDHQGHPRRIACEA
jgi:hypothetical protein